MNRSTWTVSLTWLLAACHADPQASASVEQPDLAAPMPGPERVAAQASPDSKLPRATLERGVRHAVGITEVMLDPRGRAALTLDAGGGVRLWPRLVADPAASEPYRIPIHEPLWLSLGERADGGFVLAAIGTNNAGAIYRVELPADGPATIVESFALSPEDPLLELHVLDGGDRVLALGVDHRVRLYAADGTLVSEIDERGWGPWQLRVSGGVGEPPKLVAVLAQPLRVQPLRIVDDRLEIAGPARAVELDRGPNRNDLALSPDGSKIAALRRPHKHDRQWSVELIDLETDARELIAGRVDTTVRPRMHFHRADQLLLESGSGQTFVVDLGLARTPPRAEDLHPDSKFAKRLARELEHPSITLPASGERDYALPDDDTGIRMHASVVNGVRAAVDVRHDRRLVVGPVDAPSSLAFAYPSAQIVDAAFDASGSTVVWASSRAALYVERVGDPTTLRSIELGIGQPVAVALPRADRALVLTRSSAAELDLGSGEVLRSVELSVGPSWSDSARFVPGAEGGVLGYLSSDRDEPIRLVELGATLSTRAADPEQLDDWADVRSIDGSSTRRLCDEIGLGCRFGQRFARDVADRAIYAEAAAVYLQQTPTTAEPSGSWTPVKVPGGTVNALVASPSAKLVAVASIVWGFDRVHTGQLSLIDSATDELLWTTSMDISSVTQLRWSADGSRIASVGNGRGQVFAVDDGELVYERATLGLEVATIDPTAY